MILLQGAGLFAAGFIAIVPGYISRYYLNQWKQHVDKYVLLSYKILNNVCMFFRSVAGSYDNEGIAIFALMFTYFLWIKSVKTGSVYWAAWTALSYFYMVRNDKCVRIEFGCSELVFRTTSSYCINNDLNLWVTSNQISQRGCNTPDFADVWLLSLSISAGVSLGRIRFHYQSHPPTRLCAPADESIFSENLRRLQHFLHHRAALLNADPIRGFPASQNFGAHGLGR